MSIIIRQKEEREKVVGEEKKEEDAFDFSP